MPQLDLLSELDLLYRAAGRPSYRRVSAEIRQRDDMPDTVSHETVGTILRGGSMPPRWSKVECVVRQLAAMAVHHPDPENEVLRFHALWSAAVDAHRSEQRPSHTPGAPDPIETSSTLPPPSSDGITRTTPSLSSAPERNPGFTGRVDLLASIAAGLIDSGGRPLVLHGLGGVGKSQLAAEFLHRHASQYRFVWWIAAEDPSQATAALVTLGERQEWPVSRDMAQTVRTVLTRLEDGAARWLIVYDNAGTPEDIRPLLPRAGGHLLITTRDAAWLEEGRPVEVDVFSRAESVEMLCRRGHEISVADANQLADRLGDLPLALEQVATMQSATRTPVPDYLRELDERALQFLKSTPPGYYRTTVGTAISVAIERVRQESTATAQLLELLSCLSADPISRTLLRAGSRGIPPPLGRLLEQPDVLAEAVWRLRRYGLMKVVGDGQALQVHRLVQAIVRETMRQDAHRDAFANARRLLISASPGAPDHPPAWDMYARIGPHLRPSRILMATEPEARRIVIDQASYLYEVGDFEGSRQLSEEALSAWARDNGDESEERYACLRRLVTALWVLGRYTEAYQRASEGWNRLVAHPEYGNRHPVALDLADNLAVLHRVAGHYQQALELDQMIVDAYRHDARVDENRRLQARNNLAASLRAMGKFADARDIDVALVAARRQKGRPDDHWTLFFVSNLARDLYGLGEYRAALELQQTTWETHGQQLGDRHPVVLSAWRTIVLGKRKTGQLAAARADGNRLYLICQQHLGADQELTLAAMMTYANTLFAAGEVDRAWDLSAEALTRYRSVYGELNPLTLVTAVNQAIVLRAIGERHRARQICAASFRELTHRLGADHPYVIAAAIGVGNDLVLAREEDTARRLLAGTLEDARRVLGEDHPDTLICAVNLGRLLRTGNPGAPELLNEAVGQLSRQLGSSHPMVMAASADRPLECDIEPPPV